MTSHFSPVDENTTRPVAGSSMPYCRRSSFTLVGRMVTVAKTGAFTLVGAGPLLPICPHARGDTAKTANRYRGIIGIFLPRQHTGFRLAQATESACLDLYPIITSGIVISRD